MPPTDSTPAATPPEDAGAVPASPAPDTRSRPDDHAIATGSRPAPREQRRTDDRGQAGATRGGAANEQARDPESIDAVSQLAAITAELFGAQQAVRAGLRHVDAPALVEPVFELGELLEELRDKLLLAGQEQEELRDEVQALRKALRAANANKDRMERLVRIGDFYYLKFARTPETTGPICAHCVDVEGRIVPVTCTPAKTVPVRAGLMTYRCSRCGVHHDLLLETVVDTVTQVEEMVEPALPPPVAKTKRRRR